MRKSNQYSDELKEKVVKDYLDSSELAGKITGRNKGIKISKMLMGLIT